MLVLLISLSACLGLMVHLVTLLGWLESVVELYVFCGGEETVVVDWGGSALEERCQDSEVCSKKLVRSFMAGWCLVNKIVWLKVMMA